MSAFEADRFNHSRTSPEKQLPLPRTQKNIRQLAALPEKFLQYLGCSPCQYAGPDLHLMIQAGVIHHLQDRMDGSCLWIIGTIHQAAEAGMHGCSRAHSARLNCNKQFAAAEAVITEVSSGFAQCHNFGVGGGIGVGEIAIPTPPNDAVFADDHGSDGHFVRVEGALGAEQGLLHPKFVGGAGISSQFSVLSSQFILAGPLVKLEGGNPAPKGAVIGLHLRRG
jgi:hypothetical protein